MQPMMNDAGLTKAKERLNKVKEDSIISEARLTRYFHPLIEYYSKKPCSLLINGWATVEEVDNLKVLIKPNAIMNEWKDIRITNNNQTIFSSSSIIGVTYVKWAEIDVLLEVFHKAVSAEVLQLTKEAEELESRVQEANHNLSLLGFNDVVEDIDCNYRRRVKDVLYAIEEKGGSVQDAREAILSIGKGKSN